MAKTFAAAAVIVAMLAFVACAEPDPGQELAEGLFNAKADWLDPSHLREVETEHHGDQEALFNVVVPIAIVGSNHPETGERMQQSVDDYRTHMYGILLRATYDYRQAELEDRIHMLSFLLLHPETEEVLIQVDMGPQYRSGLDFEAMMEAPEVYMAALEALPHEVDRYEDRMEAQHFDEIQEWYGY